MPAPDLAHSNDSPDHEFSFSKADFDRVRELIYKRAGISLHDGKHAMVYSRGRRGTRASAAISSGWRPRRARPATPSGRSSSTA
jgi:chemotaxis protein methyltransferase CheR